MIGIWRRAIAKIVLLLTLIAWCEGAVPPQLGVKRILVIPVDFPDLPDSAPAKTAILKALDESRKFLESNSFGKLSITSVITSELLMPHPSSIYTAGFKIHDLRTDALTAARSAGVNPDEFDYDILAFGQVGFPFGGWGTIGVRGLWIQEYVGFPVSASTICHELGHNFGLWHANAWLSPFSIGEGSKIEGGNPFDVMGGGHSFPNSHYNASFKHELGWLPAEAIHQAASSGVYRIYAHDGGTIELSRKYALSIPAGVETPGSRVDYWVECRQKFFKPGDQVLVYWRGSSTTADTYLLDTTPGSPDFGDGTVSVGRSFTDPEKRITIAPVMSGTEGDTRYFDIQVTLASTLIPPRLLKQPQSMSVLAGENVELSVLGDSTIPIRYFWRRHGTLISEADNETLRLPAITYAEGGEYSVTLSNALGSVISSTAMIVVTNAAPFECQKVPPALISWWTGDTPLDVIGTNHALAYEPSYAPGVAGNAFSFDRTNNAPKVANSPLWGMGRADFTIELWVNFAQVSSRAMFLSQDNGPGNIDKWIFWLSDSQLRFYVVNPANSARTSENIGSGRFSPNANQWYHLAVTRSNNTWNFYVNGVLLSTDVTSVLLPHPTAPLTFFGDYPGRMDDIRIYGRGLSADEILSNYRAGSTGLCQPDNAPAYLSFAATILSVDEGGMINAKIKRTGNLSSNVEVRCSAVDGSAREGINFQGFSTLLTFLPQEAEKEVTIVTLNDGVAGNRGFSIALSEASSGAVASPALARISILDRGCTPVPRGLIGWWNADSGMKSLVGTNRLTLRNGASIGPGKVGSGFRFDGVNDYAEADDPNAFGFGRTTPMSVSLWAYRTGRPGHIIGKRVGCTASEIDWQIGFSEEAIAFGGNDGPMWSAQVMPHEQWVHLTATFDGTAMRFYYNARLIGSQSSRLGLTNSAHLRIGSAGDCGPFGGLLDEIAIFDHALTPVEIEAVFTADAKGMCAPSPNAPIQFVRVRRVRDGQMQLTARGNIGSEVSLEYSSNLLEWWPVQRAVFVDNLLDFVHLPSPNAAGFYRAIRQ